MSQQAVYIVGAKRTPVGSFLGVLADVPAITLGATAVRAALEHAGVSPDKVDELYIGSVVQAGLGQAPATQVALAAGLPPTLPCTAVNKVCASGTKAIMLGASAIRTGDAHIVVAGGMENMSAVPGYLPSFRGGNKYGNVTMLDGLVRDGLQDPWDGKMMGNAAELAAEKYGFTRQQQDEYAIRSYQLANESLKQGYFKNEIVAVKKGEQLIDTDEEPLRVKYDKIPTLKPAFKKEGGTVTAANASKINDGASAVVLASEWAVQQYNLKPLARVVSYADTAREPDWFTIAPADAIPLALQRGGLSIGQVDLFEINEAFSVVVQVNAKLLDVNIDRMNVRGGAVAMGHPIGSSGCRIAVTLVNELQQLNKKYGVVGICNGGGGASALVLERV